MEKLTGTQRVWITDSSRFTPRDIQEAVNRGDSEYAMNSVHVTNSDMAGVEGWMEIGTAKIEITFSDEEEMIEKLADGLRTSIRLVKAEAQEKVTRLEEKLSQLLAIPSPKQGEAA